MFPYNEQVRNSGLGHLHHLEEACYIAITKTFIRNKPQTYIEITETGRHAFEEHSTALREILESNHKIGNNESRDKSKGHTI